MFFGIFVLNTVSISSFFVLIRVSILSIFVLKQGIFLNSVVIANGLNEKEFMGQGMRGQVTPPQPGYIEYPPPPPRANTGEYSCFPLPLNARDLSPGVMSAFLGQNVYMINLAVMGFLKT